MSLPWGIFKFGERAHTEELLAASRLLDNLNETRLQLLDDGNVVGEDTHVAGLCGNVDLDTVASEIPRQPSIISMFSPFILI
jgi:hypothetical protein